MLEFHQGSLIYSLRSLIYINNLINLTSNPFSCYAYDSNLQGAPTLLNNCTSAVSSINLDPNSLKNGALKSFVKQSKPNTYLLLTPADFQKHRQISNYF